MHMNKLVRKSTDRSPDSTKRELIRREMKSAKSGTILGAVVLYTVYSLLSGDQSCRTGC